MSKRSLWVALGIFFVEVYGMEVNLGLNAYTSQANKQLFCALINNDQEQLKYALEAGADSNFTDINGVTALMFAIDYTHGIACAKLLLTYGADIYRSDNQGYTVQNYAYFRYMRTGESCLVSNDRWFLKAVTDVYQLEPDFYQFDTQAVFFFEQLALIAHYATNDDTLIS